MGSDTDLILVLEDTLTSSVHSALDDLECLKEGPDSLVQELEESEPEAIPQVPLGDEPDLILVNWAIVLAGGLFGLGVLMVVASYWWPVQHGSIHTVWALRHL